jgi:hypothetical protein
MWNRAKTVRINAFVLFAIASCHALASPFWISKLKKTKEPFFVAA